MADHGYDHYEISNWALPGRQSRHNRIYWLNGDWIGLGPGAHSQWKVPLRQRRATPRLRSTYGCREMPVDWSELVDVRTAREDTLILGLRLREGVDAASFCKRFGVAVPDVFGPKIQRVLELGLAEWSGYRLRLTEGGCICPTKCSRNLFIYD